MGKQYRHIGKSTKRKDAMGIVTGEAIFLDDFKKTRMLYGRALRSPYPHALITHIDTSKAEALPGVKAVLTYKNAPIWLNGVSPHRSVLDRHLRQVGDGVALVAAETVAIAEEALDLIDVEYEVLEPVFDIEEAVKPEAPQLYEEFPGNEFPGGWPPYGPKFFHEIQRGNVEQGFAEADVIAEGKCCYDKIPCPLPPEAPGIIAEWETPMDLTLWGTFQSPFIVKSSNEHRMEGARIRAIVFNCGGSYGNKQDLPVQISYGAALAKEANRPVKFILTKSEQLTTYELRMGSYLNAKVGIKKDGTICAVQGTWDGDTGMSTTITQGMVAVGLGEAQVMLAKCNNWDLKTRCIATNHQCPSAVRGFGGQELKSALIPVISKAVSKLGMDPVEFYKKNFCQPGDGYFWRDGNWWVCSGLDYTKCMDEAAAKFDWKNKWKGWNTPTCVNGNIATGVGVAVHGNADSGEDESEAHVLLSPNGSAVLQCLVSESGMAERSSVCKMVAEILNLPLDAVSITPSDTMVNPFDFGLAGSRGTYACGSSCCMAAEEACKKLLEKASAMLKVEPGELETRDGVVYVKDEPSSSISWFDVIGEQHTIFGRGFFNEDHSKPNFVISFAEVEVDLETGVAKLVRMLGGSDVGKIIDPVQLEMQFHGAFGSAGADTALFEEHVLDRSTGRLLSNNLIDYKWRTFPDFPEFDTVLLESEADTHRFKAIGVGEITGAPAPPAILMAISNAIGMSIDAYPCTPQVILKALGKA